MLEDAGNTKVLFVLFHRDWLRLSDWSWARVDLCAWFTCALSKTILMFVCEFKRSQSLCRSKSLKINFQRLEMYFPGVYGYLNPCCLALLIIGCILLYWLRCLWDMYGQISTNNWDWFMSYRTSVAPDGWCSLGVVWVVSPVQLLGAACTLPSALLPLWEWEGPSLESERDFWMSALF